MHSGERFFSSWYFFELCHTKSRLFFLINFFTCLLPFFFSSLISQQGKHGRSDSTKRDSCDDCEVNTKAENAGSVECENCAAGTLSEAGSAECRSCEAGMYSNEVGVMAVCVGCESGKYRQSKESDGKSGFTDIITDPTKCVDCPTGWSSAKGSTKCQACGAGTYGDGCKLCPLGYARNGTDHDATQCQLCKLGETTAQEGSASCERW